MEFSTSSITVDGKSVEVRELSARQRQTLFKLNKDDLDPLEIQANIIKMGCNDYASIEVDAILDIPGRAFDAIATAVLSVSGLSEDDQEGAEKN